MADRHDTYDRRIQPGAARRRREDAEALYQSKRWTGAIYLAGYAIECSLKSLICCSEGKNNFKDTHMFKRGKQGATLHDLALLLHELPSVRRAILLDRTGVYKEAWNTLTRLWQKDELRYGDKVGNKGDSQNFMEAMQVIHVFLLNEQGEAS